jgi:hypothetical protein
MSLAHSPRIVTDGLALCLDAANIKSLGASYIGSSKSLGTTPSNPSGNASHILLAAAYSISSTNNISTPTGWTAIGSNIQGNSNVQLFWALGNVASLVFTNARIVQVLAFSNVNTTAPIRGSVTWTVTNSSANTTAIPSNTANANDVIVVGCYNWQNNTTASMIIGSPYTEAQNSEGTEPGIPGGDRGSTGYLLPANAGPTPAYNVPTFQFQDRVAFNVVLASQVGPTWNDLSGLGNTGTLTNGPTYDSSNNGSIVFDGTDDHCQILNRSTILNLTNSFTFSAFVKFTTSGGQYAIFAKNSAWADGWTVYMRQGPQFAFLGFNTSGVNSNPITTPAGEINSNTWYNICYTYNGVNVIGYVNAVQKVSTAFSGPFRNQGSTVSRIGEDTTLGLPPYRWTGSISNVQLYDRALTAAEIQQNFNALRGRYSI